MLAPVPHRQYVFTIPRVLWPVFARRRALLGKLCNIIERIFDRAYASTRPGARAGIILFVQTFGDLVNFNPHIHVFAADGAFDADGGFTVLAPIPSKVLEPWFRAEVLALLRCEGMVSEVLAEKMLAWRHTGFSAHNSVRVRARDAAGRRRLAQYMLRAPFSLEKMSYDPDSGTVIYRSRMHKTLKRNFQVMHEARRGRSTWARLSHKIYEVDPLECPRCKGPMRVIALIDDEAVIRKILTHLGLWAPQQTPKTQIGPPAPDPPGQSKPVLTYHPVPDIA